MTATAIKTEREIREHLTEKAASDSAFRAKLLADPRGTVESEFQVTVPEGFDVQVHEETAAGVHLVLPPAGGRLSRGEMQAVAGGDPGHLQGSNDHGW